MRRRCLLALTAACVSCAEALAPIDPIDADAHDAAEASVSTEPTTAPGGYVYAVAYDQQIQGNAPIAITHYGALFAENAPRDDAFVCPAQAVGGCMLYRCATPSAGDPLRFASAGTVHVQGPVHTYDMRPGPTNEYGEALDGAERQWSTGDRLVVHADGDAQGVPSFDADLELPAHVDVGSSNGFDINHPLFIAPHTDLPFQWTPAGTGEVMVRAYASTAGGGLLLALVCRDRVDAATLTVPAAGLDAVFDGTRSETGVIEVWRANKLVALDAAWHVEVRAARQIAFGSLQRR